MTRDGLIERDAATGEETRVSMRGQEFSLKSPSTPADTQPQGSAPRRYHSADSSKSSGAALAPDGTGTQPYDQRTAGDVRHPAVSPSGPATDRQHIARYQQQHAADAEKPTASTPEAAPQPGRLQFAADEKPPEPLGKKLSQASMRAERADGKLNGARENLPTRRRPRLAKEFDEGKGKMKRRLVFDEQVKSRHQHLKGAAPLRPVKGAANTGIGYAHKKLYGVEDENVGTRAAHRSEMAAEGLTRSAYRLNKTRPYRKVERLQHKATKANMRLSYQKALADNPKLQSNVFSRMAQKLRIRRQYAKAAREAKRAGKAAQQAGSLAVRAFNAVTGFISRHPVAMAIVGLLAVLMMMVSTMFSSCSSMSMGGMGTVLASSYLAADSDIDDAELGYTEWETDMLLEARNAETTHAGYDEYRRNIADVGHNPFELMAYLTAVYQDFTMAGVQSELRAIFAAQYSITLTPEVEERYNDPDDLDGDGDTEPYDWNILHIKVTSRPLAGILASRMDAGQTEIYNILMETHGNRQYVKSPFAFGWMQYVSDYYGYRIHPTTGEKDYHKAVDIAVSQGTEILAAHDGVVTVASSDASYGNYIVLEGENGVSTKYAHCQRLLVGAGTHVVAGTPIALVGSTGVSTGPHLHFEVLKDGQHLNPLYFAECPDDGSTLPPGSPGGPQYPTNPGAPVGDGSFAALLAEAQAHIGKPYVFGASGPDYFDCSGYISWIFNQSGVASFGRTTAQGLYNMSTPVASPQPGDLVFFHSTYSTPNTVTHVGLYIGGGRMLHCGDPIGYADLGTSYWQQHFYAYGRISG